MCYITETARASQRSSFQLWLITHGLFFIICITVASGGSYWDLSHVVLGASVVPYTYCSFIQIALTQVSGGPLWDDLGFISLKYHVKQDGTFAGRFFLVPSFARKPEVRVGSGLLKGVTLPFWLRFPRNSLLCSTSPRRQGLCCFSWPMGDTSHDFTVFACIFAVAVPNFISHWHINTSDFFLLSLVFYELLKYMQKIVIWLV